MFDSVEHIVSQYMFLCMQDPGGTGEPCEICRIIHEVVPVELRRAVLPVINDSCLFFCLLEEESKNRSYLGASK